MSATMNDVFNIIMFSILSLFLLALTAAAIGGAILVWKEVFDR